MDKDYFSSRRSVRRYQERDVDDALLDSIFRRAMKAPTCGNMQLYSVVVSRDAESRKRLAPCHFNQPMVEQAPVVLTICADFHRFSRWCRVSGADPGYDNFLSFVTAMTDATILAQQITTIAELEGLGTCWLGTVTYNAPQISEILRLPEQVVPVACLTLGWPAEEGQPTERLSTEAWVHKEYYRDDNDEEIRRLFKEKEDYPQNKEYVKENNAPSLASIFTDIRYPRQMNEEFSATFLDLLKEKEFLK